MAVSGQSDLAMQEEQRTQADEAARASQRHFQNLIDMLRRWNADFRKFLESIKSNPIQNVPDQASENLSKATSVINPEKIKDAAPEPIAADQGEITPVVGDEELAQAKADEPKAENPKSTNGASAPIQHSFGSGFSGGGGAGVSCASSRPVNFMPKISFPDKEKRQEIWQNLKAIDYKDLGTNLLAGAGSALAVKTVIGGSAATLGVAGGLTTAFAIVAGAGVAGASVEALRQYKEEMERLKQEAGGEITSEELWEFRMQALRSLDKKACAKAFWDKCGAGFLWDAGKKFFSNWSEKGFSFAIGREARKEYGSIFMQKGTALVGAAIGVSLAEDLPDAADKMLRVVESPAYAQEIDPSLVDEVAADSAAVETEEPLLDADEGNELAALHEQLEGLRPDDFATIEIDGVPQQVIIVDQPLEGIVGDESSSITVEGNEAEEDETAVEISDEVVEADTENGFENVVESETQQISEPINTDGMASWEIHNLAVEKLWDGGAATLENREIAIPLFLEAAAEGSDLAMRDLGDLYEWGYVSEAQITEALGEYGTTMTNPDPALNLPAQPGFVDDSGSVQPFVNDNNDSAALLAADNQVQAETTVPACDDGVVSNGFSTYDYWHLNQYITHNELFSHPEHGVYFAENWLDAENDPQAIKDIAQRLFWMDELEGNQEVAMALYREAAALGNEQAIRDIEQITSMGLNGYVDPGPIAPCEVPEELEIEDNLTETFTETQGQPYIPVDPNVASEMLFRDPDIVLPAGAPHTFILGDTRVSLPPPPNDVYASAYCRDMQIIPPGGTEPVNACSYAISELELPVPANDVYAGGDEPALANNLN